MATYFRKYYFEFQDSHPVNPAMWRVDILDSQGVTPTTPFLLKPSGTPVIKERVDVSEDKSSAIIGSQLTISYEVRENFPTDPLPDEFFEADEKRYKVELRKNGVIEGVYYIKPDFCQYPDQAAPFTVELKAVDGLSYATGQPFDVSDIDGSLLYDKISLYEAIMTRALSLVLDPQTKMNVVNTLVPTNIEDGVKLLFGTFVHTDIFYDFVEGAKSVRDVLMAFCKSFYARILIEAGEVWFVRTQDLLATSFTADLYTNPTTVTEVPLPGFVRIVGPSAAYDAIPVNVDGLNRKVPAIKKAEFETEYKGINQLLNYDWVDFDGSAFDQWYKRFPGQPNPGRTGAGTIDDRYKARLPYDTNGNYSLGQSGSPLNSPNNPALTLNVGQILDFELPYRFNNTKTFKILIYAVVQNKTVPGDILFWVLDSGGSWHLQAVGADRVMGISRTGKKRNGSMKIRSLPLPFYKSDYYSSSAIIVELFYPEELSDEPDGPEPNSVDISPLKLGIISTDTKGRHIRIENNADFSQVKDVEKFKFIDTGEAKLSNSLYTGTTKVPVEGWVSGNPGVPDQGLERHMAAAHIDQYRKSITMWEGTLLSNTLKFYHVLEFVQKTGKRFEQISDTYDIRECEHRIVLAEVMAEGSAEYTYTEWDIEDEKEE